MVSDGIQASLWQDPLLHGRFRPYTTTMAAATATVFLAICLAFTNAQASGNLVEVLSGNKDFSMLVDLVVKAGLADTVANGGPFTVFAPTNAAFANLDPALVDGLLADTEQLKSVLLYHVVPGRVLSSDLSNDLVVNSAQGSPLRVNIYENHGYQKVTVNGVRVVQPDLEASNGVAHVIDEVLLPPAGGDIVDVLAGDSRFTTLVQAVQAAGLVDTLKSDGTFTVFAPTDEAFARLPAGALDSLVKDVPALTTVLLRHVVTSGTYYSHGLCWEKLTTANNMSLKAGYNKYGNLMVHTAEGRASIVQPDINASNGVIHVIDNII
ncbi:transforming growth factor-beta-induced protein ig-h3-like [Panulirus ornatus]|uniref:transforming growth factor-beta-induced protein ig-h3-like n=1 Tax=Panulirus ornatus TaxID=150431 RepID=UPI003A87BDF3